MGASRGLCLISRRRFTAVLGVAAALAAILIAASQVGARDARRPVDAPAQAALFVGIEQHGAALGSPRAPVTFIEYADVGIDSHSLERIAWSRATTRAIARGSQAARLAGVQGTPSFEVGRTGDPMHRVHVGSLDAAGIRPELDAALGGE